MPTTGRFRRFCSKQCADFNYRATHREQSSAASKAWVKAHPERSRAIKNKWAEAHRDETTAKRREVESQPGYHAEHYRKQLERLGEDVVRSEMRIRTLMRRFGLTPETYDALLDAQNGVCAICGKTPEENGRALAVDHDHTCCPKREKTCGKCIRGLLCSPCNQRLGIIEDIEWMELANNYLKQYQ
jgi:hypothetical protein